MGERGVEVRTGFLVTKVDEDTVSIKPTKPPQQQKDQSSLEETLDVGALVWTGGVKARPFVRELAKALGQKDLRGLNVDTSLRVKGAEGVYAIGDAALSGYAPTAQVAENEGKHVGRSIRDGVDSPFKYGHKGSLVNLGEGNGIAQLVAPNNSALNIWDALGAPKASETIKGEKVDEVAFTGPVAWALWRSLYWTKLLSNKSRFALSMDWFKAMFSGRNVVEPVLKRQDTLVLPANWKAKDKTSTSTSDGKKSRLESFGTPLQRNSTVRAWRRGASAVKEGVKEERKKILGLF